MGQYNWNRNREHLVKLCKIHTIQCNTVISIITHYHIVSYSAIQRYTIETLLYLFILYVKPVRMTAATVLCLLLSLTHQITSLPVDPPLGLVIPPTTTTSLPPPTTKLTKTGARDPSEIQAPEMTRFHVDSRIQFRYARTVMEAHIKNPDIAPQLATFAVVIPESAFISNFSMVLDGREFVARVEEKEKAKETFDEAVTNGLGAGLVSQDVRDSNRFIIS